ncbi:MAG TPA: hypothetical protein VNQ76_22215 [Planctomicrobium sp.]|nr:hypothetical protein [Planctomicrobium sp.]
MRHFAIPAMIFLFLFTFDQKDTIAADPPSPAAAMRKLLESGRVPEQRLPTVVKMICERGHGGDLEFILGELLKENTWNNELKSETLGWLATAATQRKVVPTGDPSGVAQLLQSDDLVIQQRAIDLTGLWQVKSAEPALLALAEKSAAPAALRKQALEALAVLDKEKAESVLQQIATKGTSFELRAMGTGVLADVNPKVAAVAASELFKSAGPQDPLAPLLDAFLNLKEGADALATGLKANPPSKDTAKLLLRHMYSIGRTDAALNSVLLDIAEINQNAPPPTKEELDALVKAVAKSGDIKRGEEIFRRAELSCMNCHAVSKGGGDIGPDLSAIGSSSPVEYLIMSLLDPDQAIKEAYVTKVIATVDGKVLQGIEVSRTTDTLTLKDATGKVVQVPTDDIDDEIEGKSLMPKGLTNFMTQAEFLDLIAFLGELGKPGPYGIRDTPRMQRYRFLSDLTADAIHEASNSPELTKSLLASGNWGACYSRTNGELPLAELVAKTGQKVVFVRGDISVLQSGPVEIQVKSSAKVTVWLDDRELGAGESFPVELTDGEHSLFVRADTTDAPDATLLINLHRPAGSSVQFVVVDGP